MIEEQDPIFDIVYSLPILSHSAAVATRTPGTSISQKSKYLPEYGGFLDTPWSKLKNNSLGKGFPFCPRSELSVLTYEDAGSRRKDQFVDTSECLVCTTHLGDPTEQFSTVRALNDELRLDLIEQSFDEEENKYKQKSTNYSSAIYEDKISGIKYCPDQETLLVKFHNCVEVTQLSRDESVLQTTGSTETRKAQETIATISEEDAVHIRDVCLNVHNQSIVALGGDGYGYSHIKLYDLTVDAKNPFNILKWETQGNPTPKNSGEKILRGGRVVRSYVSEQPPHGIRQLENVPDHLVNMVLTTDYHTILVDPRLDSLSQVLVDRSKLPSIYPIEFLRSIEFSRKNSYQFYLLSNTHLRVFDTRYPGMPMSQLNHMLDSDLIDTMKLKLFNHPEYDFETLCTSTSKTTCFITFDQSQVGNLVNPSSAHLPVHDKLRYNNISDENLDTHGLDIISNRRQGNGYGLFSILQLSINGDLFIRDYKERDPSDEDRPIGSSYETQAQLIMQQDTGLGKREPNHPCLLDYDCVLERDIYEDETLEEEGAGGNFIVLKPPENVERQLESVRASKKYHGMEEKLSGK